MTAKEAYKIIKQAYAEMVVIECLEFPDFYAFGLTEKGKENESVVGGYFTVAKDSGKLGGFNPTSDFEAFFAAKSIDVSTFNWKSTFGLERKKRDAYI